MQYRRFGRTGWFVGEVGYGMWGMGGQWDAVDDEESLRSLERATELGVNFFDTAWAYGDGRSERLLGNLVARHGERKIYAATKIPPKNREWPSGRDSKLEDVFPPEYVREYVQRSLDNLGLDRIDLMQFHVWEDAWAHDERWQEATRSLKDEGLVEYASVTDDEALEAFVSTSRAEGIIPALETAHAIHHAEKVARELGRGKNLVVNLSGRGDKDIGVVAEKLGMDAREAGEDPS